MSHHGASDVRECTMSDEFYGLGATEKAALESTLYSCRALVGRIGEELRRRSPSTSLTRVRLQSFTPPSSALPRSLNKLFTSAGGDGGRKPVRSRIANAKSFGWARGSRSLRGVNAGAARNFPVEPPTLPRTPRHEKV
jgi:hypothetical protein